VLKFDLHTHHKRCAHADGDIRDYIEAAIKEGLHVIGISDHAPYLASEDDHPNPRIAMAKSEFPGYVSEMLDLKEQYRGRIEVLLGVESDFFPEHVNLYRDIYARYPFDYVIGSVHHSGGDRIFNRNRFKELSDEQKLEMKETYYDLILQSARSGMFQILGHIDAMKVYFTDMGQVQTPAVDRALKGIAECGTAIELNTSGVKTCGSWYPADDILERALYYGVDVTFGSDAHSPSRVAGDWEEARERLKQIGFQRWVYFRKRQKQFVPL
jgi:histidinol-phosphatase (PHP family)